MPFQQQADSEPQLNASQVVAENIFFAATLKSKAHDMIVITEWLVSLVIEPAKLACPQRGTYYCELRAGIVWSWAKFFEIIRNAGVIFNDSEKANDITPLMFDGWRAATQWSIENRQPLWKIFPKLHLMCRNLQRPSSPARLFRNLSVNEPWSFHEVLGDVQKL